MAQLYEGESTKFQSPAISEIIDQLEKALMEIKYNQLSNQHGKLNFNKIQNHSIKSETRSPPQFIGKELMLFEMMVILNEKISVLEKKYDKLKNSLEKKHVPSLVESSEISNPIQKICDYAKEANNCKISQNEAWNQVLEASQKLDETRTVLPKPEKIDTYDLKLTKVDVKINELISEVFTKFNSSVKVPVRIGLDNEVEITLDKNKVRNVLLTLFKNAIEHTEKGHIKVETFVAHEQKMAIIRIFDTGIGISEKILPKIFEKKSGTNLKPEFTNEGNLCLYWCSRIIKEHNGTLTVKNNERNGCTFTLTLPIKN